MKSSISELQSKLADWSDENFYMGFSHEDSDGHPTHCGIFFDSNHWTKYADMELIKQYIDPKKIKELTIGCEKDNETNYIPKEFISEFSNIEYLELSRLKFNRGQYILDRDIFENLRHLKMVIFDRMTLQPLPPELFQHCAKLERLEFRDIHTYQIPLGLFHNLRELKIFEFYGGPGRYYGTDYTEPFENLDPELLINNTKLEIFILSIGDTAFPEVPVNLFENCVLLKILQLAGSKDNKSCLGRINLEKNKNLKKVLISTNICEDTRDYLNNMRERRPDVEFDIDASEN